MCCHLETYAKSLLLSGEVLLVVVCLSEIVVSHRGGLDPLGSPRHEQKYILIKSTEYQAVEGSSQTTESYIHLMLWGIMQSGEEIYIRV